MSDILDSVDWETKAKDKVLTDFKRASEFMKSYHDEYLERYGHYMASQIPDDGTVKKAKHYFPVPFTTEQVDNLKSSIREKLFHRNKPCTIYGREKTDQGDAEAKQELFDYQDSLCNIESLIDKALTTCALAGFIPCQVTYEERTTTEVVEQQIPITDDAGNMVLDNRGLPIGVPVSVPVKVPKYKGAWAELIDVSDFFVTPEKKENCDDEGIIVRSYRLPRYFDGKPYFFNQDKIKKREDTDGGGDISDESREKRERRGNELPQDYYGRYCTYLEWQGYYDPGEDIEAPSGELFKPGFYIIGVVTGVAWEDTIVRFDGPKGDHSSSVFPFDGSNVVIGALIEEQGEFLGSRFADKFHSAQHAQDSLMGAWFANLRQLIKRPKVVNSDAIIHPEQINTAEDEVIEVTCREDVGREVRYVDVPNISQDVYAGLEMLRQMGQNGSGRHDITEGKVQRGVETRGEAEILASSADVSTNAYLKTFERTFIKPLYEKRNAINAAYLDTEYVFWVIGEKGLEWRTIEPGQIRAQVDFVCEASSREIQRGVIAQQILQSFEPMLSIQGAMAASGMPPNLLPRPDLLLKKLFEQWTWQNDEIEKLLPSVLMQDANTMEPNMPMTPIGGGINPNMPQPTNNQETQASAMSRNITRVGKL